MGQFHPSSLSEKLVCFNPAFKVDRLKYTHYHPCTFHHWVSFKTGTSEACMRTFLVVKHARYKCITTAMYYCDSLYQKSITEGDFVPFPI